MGKLLDMPEFKAIIEGAKIVALANGRGRLDRGGFAAAALALAHRPELKAISLALKQLQSKSAELDLDLASLSQETIGTSSPMPLDPDFRGLLARHHDGGVPEIIALVRDCLSEPTVGSNVASSPSLGSRPLDTACLPLLRMASDIADTRGHHEIDGASLALACWSGHRIGLFKNRPSLVAHIDAHASVFRAFVNGRRYKVTNPNSCIDVKPLAASIRDHKPRTEDDLFELISIATQTALFADSRLKAAYHEAGHAVAYAILRPDIRIAKLSIKPTATSAGEISTLHPGKDGHVSGSKDAIFKHAVCLLAGRAAEIAKFGSEGLNVGARSDIEAATEIVWAAVTADGFADEFGPINLQGISRKQFGAGGYLSQRAERVVRKKLAAAKKNSEDFVRHNWASIAAVAEQLLAHQVLDEDEVRRAIDDSAACGLFRRLKRIMARRKWNLLRQQSTTHCVVG